VLLSISTQWQTWRRSLFSCCSTWSPLPEALDGRVSPGVFDQLPLRFPKWWFWMPTNAWATAWRWRIAAPLCSFSCLATTSERRNTLVFLIPFQLKFCGRTLLQGRSRVISCRPSITATRVSNVYYVYNACMHVFLLPGVSALERDLLNQKWVIQLAAIAGTKRAQWRLLNSRVEMHEWSGWT
jgi:hypothetical protein